MSQDWFFLKMPLPRDLYDMICRECERQEAITDAWPGFHIVIREALYEHFGAIERSYGL